jgi:hypothetical protein
MEQRVISAAEFERLTPAEQDAVFQASIVRDLDLVRPEFLARIRDRALEHITASEADPKR